MVKDVPDLPSHDRDVMWITKDELLNWRPTRDVAKPYPAKGAAEARREAP